MTVPLRHLADVAAALRAGELGTADAEQLADALERISLGADADAALGLRLKPGQRHTLAQVAARDGVLREAAQKFWPDATEAERARQLCSALSRYHGGRWQRDRAAADCPHPGDKLAAYLWQMLRLHDRKIGLRQMVRVLARDDMS